MAQNVHHVPGRLRVRVPRVKNNPEYGRVVETSIAGMEGVSAVQANPVTGSVIIHYDPRTAEVSALFARLADHGLATETAIARRHSGPAKIANKVGEAVAMYVLQAAIERSVPLLITALL